MVSTVAMLNIWLNFFMVIVNCIISMAVAMALNLGNLLKYALGKNSQKNHN